MTESGFDYAERRYIPISDDTAEALRIRQGDLYVSRGNGSLHLLGRVTLAQEPPERIVFPDTMIRLRFYPDAVAGKFINLLWQGRVVRQQIEKRARTTAGIYKISQRDIEAFRIPVAPLAEQRRIVEKVEELFSDLDAGVAALERVRTKLTRYRSAVLHAAVTGRLTAAWRDQHGPPSEPGPQLLQRVLAERRRQWEERTLARYARDGRQPPKGWRDRYPQPAEPNTEGLPELPAGWCWVTVDQLSSHIRNGYFQSPTGLCTGVPILRINAVRPMDVRLGECRYLPDSDALRDYFIEDGDLLFTRYNGSVELLGVAGMVRGCTEPVVHPDKLIRVKAVLSHPQPAFLEVACNAGMSRAHMVGRARTTAGQTGISGTDVKETPVPLPPVAEQAAVVEAVQEKLSQIDALEAEVGRGLARAGRLRQAILKAAFEGRLVPQDPTDEPAATLLERLRRSRAAEPKANGRKPRPARGIRRPGSDGDAPT
jgi:type I restriction enzyme S subunit